MQAISIRVLINLSKKKLNFVVRKNLTLLERTILGVDPGTNIMGYGIILCKSNKIEIIECGTFDIKKEKDSFEKLKKIYNFTIDLIERYKPTELAIESQFYGNNVQSMLKLGRAQGIVIAACLSKDLVVTEYSPRKIKQAITGRGNASKEQVLLTLKNMFDFNFNNKTLDASDALAVAICHGMQNSIFKQNVKNKSWKSFISENPDRVISRL